MSGAQVEPGQVDTSKEVSLMEGTDPPIMSVEEMLHWLCILFTQVCNQMLLYTDF